MFQNGQVKVVVMGKLSDLVRALAVALSGEEEAETELGALQASPQLTEP